MSETRSDIAADLNTLREERLRLERELLEVERGRLAAVNTRTEGEAKLDHGQHSVMLATALLLALAAFLVGLILGAGGSDYRERCARERRLSAALSQLSGGFVEPLAVTTNSPSSLPPEILNRAPQGTHRNVSVVVIE